MTEELVKCRECSHWISISGPLGRCGIDNITAKGNLKRICLLFEEVREWSEQNG